MSNFELIVKPTVDVSQVESKVQKPLQKAVSEYAIGLNDATSQALKNVNSTVSNFKAPETSTFEKLLFAALSGGAIGAGVGAAIGAPGGPTVLPAALVGGLTGALTGIAGVLIDEMFNEREIRSQINFDNLGLTVQERLSPAVLDRIVVEAQNTIFGAANETIAQLALSFERRRGETINFEDFLKIEHPEAAKFFKPERIQQINELMKLFRSNLQETQAIQEKGNQITAQTNQVNQEQAIIYKDNAQAFTEIGESQSTVTKQNKELTENIKQQNDQVKQAEKTLGTMDSSLGNVGDKAQSLDRTITNGTNNIQNYGDTAKRVADGGLTDLEGKVEDVGTAASNLNLAEAVKDLAGFDPNDFLPGFLKPLVQADEQVKQVGDTFEDTSKRAQNSLDELGVFASDIASEINNTFADLIFRGLKGNLDSLSDLWDSTLDAMLNTFAQFAATIISNPIRIALDAVLRGEGGSAGGSGGGGGGGKGLFGTIGSIFDIGKGFKTIGKGLSKIPGVSSIVDSVKGLFAEGGALAGIGSFLSSALPVVGAIASVLSVAIPILTGLFKKTPRLDIDFDSVKTELGRRAAFVNELLDPDFFKDSIAQISVKRSAGLGVGGDDAIKDLIQKKIKETVDAVRAIIFKLPTDLADTLTEELLNTPLDTETEVAGERLFEFDAKGKKIAEKFNQLINGEIQAKFLFAVDGFLQTMFESLGVLPEAAEAFLDEKFQEFKNAGSREARAKVGEELLADINAFVDAFNIVSGNVNDSIGQTIQNEEWEYRLAA